MNIFWGKLLRFQKDKNPSKQVKVSNDFESVLRLSVDHSYYSSIIPITLVFATGFLAVVCIAKKYYFTLPTHPPPLHTEP
jgi:hypothetical protein